MTSLAPQIGFDRFISLELATAALRARAGTGSIEEVRALLDAAGYGREVQRKTLIVLNRLWLEPRQELIGFANRGVAIFQDDPTVPASALTWGMAVATYPFFGKVAELVGRLSALQGDCASSEVHRRMSEVYGERESTYRTTNRVLQSQSDWGVIERVEKGKRIQRNQPIVLTKNEVVGWLVEAALQYQGKAVPIASLQSLPVMFPFVLDCPISYVISLMPTLEIRSEGGTNQLVSLASS